MQRDAEIIELLNDVLTAELTSINQYFLDAKMLDNWGYDRLAHHFREESIDEMKDADVLIERILFLDGVPNVQRLSAVRVGETAVEKLALALELERESIERLNNGIAQCLTVKDDGTRELLEHVLEGEEEHVDWLETQLELVRQVGESSLPLAADPRVAGPGRGRRGTVTRRSRRRSARRRRGDSVCSPVEVRTCTPLGIAAHDRRGRARDHARIRHELAGRHRTTRGAR